MDSRPIYAAPGAGAPTINDDMPEILSIAAKKFAAEVLPIPRGAHAPVTVVVTVLDRDLMHVAGVAVREISMPEMSVRAAAGAPLFEVVAIDPARMNGGS